MAEEHVIDGVRVVTDDGAGAPEVDPSEAVKKSPGSVRKEMQARFDAYISRTHEDEVTADDLKDVLGGDGADQWDVKTFAKAVKLSRRALGTDGRLAPERSVEKLVRSWVREAERERALEDDAQSTGSSSDAVVYGERWFVDGRWRGPSEVPPEVMVGEGFHTILAIEPARGDAATIADHVARDLQKRYPDRFWYMSGRLFEATESRDPRTGDWKFTLEPVTKDGVASVLAEYSWVKRVQGDEGYDFEHMTNSPAGVVARLSHWHPHAVFQEIVGIATMPLITRDGRVITANGYDAESKVLVRHDLDEGILEEALRDPDAFVKAHLPRITEAVLHDFPYNSDEAKISALAFAVTVLLRFHLERVPGFAVDKPSAGAGSSLLVRVVSELAGGLVTYARLTNDDKADNREILSAQMANAALLVFDNVDRKVRSAALAQAMTERVVDAAALYAYGITRSPVTSVIAMTGIGIEYHDDMPRRFVNIELTDVDLNARTEFRLNGEDALLNYVRMNRSLLFATLLAMFEGWRRAGSPPYVGEAKMPSFDGWLRTVGGILQYHLGRDIPFLEGRAEWLGQESAETQQAKGIVDSMFRHLNWSRRGERGWRYGGITDVQTVQDAITNGALCYAEQAAVKPRAVNRYDWDDSAPQQVELVAVALALANVDQTRFSKGASDIIHSGGLYLSRHVCGRRVWVDMGNWRAQARNEAANALGLSERERRKQWWQVMLVRDRKGGASWYDFEFMTAADEPLEEIRGSDERAPAFLVAERWLASAFELAEGTVPTEADLVIGTLDEADEKDFEDRVRFTA